MFLQASLTPVLAAIIFFHYGFVHSRRSVSRLFPSLTYSRSHLCPSRFVLSPFFFNFLLTLSFPPPFSHLPLSHLHALTLSPSLTPSLSLSPEWTQLFLTPLSHKADRQADGGAERDRNRDEKDN